MSSIISMITIIIIFFLFIVCISSYITSWWKYWFSLVLLFSYNLMQYKNKGNKLHCLVETLFQVTGVMCERISFESITCDVWKAICGIYAILRFYITFNRNGIIKDFLLCGISEYKRKYCLKKWISTQNFWIYTFFV